MSSSNQTERLLLIVGLLWLLSKAKKDGKLWPANPNMTPKEE